MVFDEWIINKQEQDFLHINYDFINSLKFEFEYVTNQNYIDYVDLGATLYPWIRQLNYRLSEIEFSIMNFLYYYKRGNHFDTFYKDYFYNGFLSEYSSIEDGLYHILNIYYNVNIKEKTGFTQRVKNGLKDKNIKLYKILDEFYNKCKLKKVRNDKTHNYNPNIHDKGYSKDNIGVTIFYMPTKISSEEQFDLLKSETEKLKKLMSDIIICMEEDVDEHLNLPKKNIK